MAAMTVTVEEHLAAIRGERSKLESELASAALAALADEFAGVEFTFTFQTSDRHVMTYPVARLSWDGGPSEQRVRQFLNQNVDAWEQLRRFTNRDVKTRRSMTVRARAAVVVAAHAAGELDKIRGANFHYDFYEAWPLTDEQRRRADLVAAGASEVLTSPPITTFDREAAMLLFQQLCELEL